MKTLKHLIIFTLLMSGILNATSQSKLWCFKGTVYDAETHDPIPFAYITTSDFKQGTTTNTNGQFELCDLKGDSIHILINHTAFNAQSIVVYSSKPQQDIFLEIKKYNTSEVTVTAQKSALTSSYIPGKLTLKKENILTTPTLLGSPDVVKSLQLMPGIQSVNEGNSGIYVRGGSPGQNYVMFDDIELINPSHIMGIFSVFNPLLTDRVDFYKGNAPVHQTNRLASSIIVHSIQQKTPDYNWAGNIGNISSNLTYNGKTKNNKWFFSTGLRRSYIELLSMAASTVTDNSYFKNNNYYFIDFNGKISYRSGNNQLTFNWYKGQDVFNINNNDNTYTGNSRWGNAGCALVWQHQINDASQIHSGIDYTSYNSYFETEFDEENIYFSTDLKQLRYKLDYSLNKNKHFLRSGVRIIYGYFTPQDIKTNFESSVISQKDIYENMSTQLYVSDLITISEKWQAYAGFKVEHYGLLNNESSSLLKEESTHLNSTLTLNYFVNESSSFKASYAYSTQNIHLASIASIPLPTDVWMPVTAKLPHEKGQQATLGYFKNFNDAKYEFGVECYAKSIKNQLLLNPNIEGDTDKEFEDNFFIGDSKGYGTELLLRKNTGKTTASLSYTLGKTQQQFPDINNGEWFDAKYDRTHDINLVVTHKPNKRIDFGMVFTYATGNTATLPTGRYFIMGSIANDYEGINNYRMPAYHRLDFSMNYYLNSKIFNESVLNFSIINVYNHANPYFIYFEISEGEEQYDMSIKAKQSSLFPILPSLSWRFKF